MKNKKFRIITLVLSLAILMSTFTFSFAYFTDRASTGARATAGTLDIDLTVDFEGKQVVSSGDEIHIYPHIINKGNKSAAIKLVLVAETDDESLFKGVFTVSPPYDEIIANHDCAACDDDFDGRCDICGANYLQGIGCKGDEAADEHPGEKPDPEDGDDDPAEGDEPMTISDYTTDPGYDLPDPYPKKEYTYTKILDGNESLAEREFETDTYSILAKSDEWNPDIILKFGSLIGAKASYVKVKLQVYACQYRNVGSDGWTLIDEFEVVQ